MSAHRRGAVAAGPDAQPPAAAGGAPRGRATSLASTCRGARRRRRPRRLGGRRRARSSSGRSSCRAPSRSLAALQDELERRAVPAVPSRPRRRSSRRSAGSSSGPSAGVARRVRRRALGVGARAVLLPLAIAAERDPDHRVRAAVNNWFGVAQPAVQDDDGRRPVVLPGHGQRDPRPVRGRAGALELMRSYAASESDVLRKVRIPNSLPFFFTALKLGATLSLIGAIVARVLRRQPRSSSAGSSSRARAPCGSTSRGRAILLGGDRRHRVLPRHRARRAPRRSRGTRRRAATAERDPPRSVPVADRASRRRSRYRSAVRGDEPPARRRWRRRERAPSGGES